MGSTQLALSKCDQAARIIIGGISSGALKEQEMTLINHFAKGVYARELHIPKGTVLVGKIHRYECINIMLTGDITVYSDDGEKRISDPFIAVSPPGTQRAGIAHEDTVWICIHGTSSKNLDIIEKEFIAPSNSDALLLKELRKLKG